MLNAPRGADSAAVSKLPARYLGYGKFGGLLGVYTLDVRFQAFGRYTCTTVMLRCGISRAALGVGKGMLPG